MRVKRRPPHIYGVLVLLLASMTTQAAPIVIKDYGGTSTGVPSLQALRDAYADGSANLEPPPMPQPIDPFPVRTRIKPGVLQAPVRLAANTPTPFFIIGYDDLSLRWFERNKQYLLSLKAVGYATNIDTARQMEELNNRLAPLQAFPLPLDEAADKLAIPVYPVLIIGNEIKQ